MQRDFIESLLRSGIIEAKAGETGTARRYLERVIQNSSDHNTKAEAWFWMSGISDDPAEKRHMLENCLSHNMRHTRARRALALIDGKLKPEEIIDPDRLGDAPGAESSPDMDRIMCPQCGARMHYAADGQTLACDFCASRPELDTQAEAEEQDFLIAMATARGHRKPVSTQVSYCQGCGAEFILPPKSFSYTCVYCESPHVVSLEKSRELIHPEGIIPYAIDQKQAFHFLSDWAENERIQSQEELAPPRGIFLPVWTFDIGGGIEYSGYTLDTEEDFSSRLPGSVREEGFYPVHIDDLPIPASRNTAGHLARLLPTFDLHAAKPYDPRYLANWGAEVYSVPMSDASLDARSQAFSHLKRKLPREITSLQQLRTSSAKLTIETFKLVFLPVWITEIAVREEPELVLINGQNGALKGPRRDSPGFAMLDWLKELLED